MHSMKLLCFILRPEAYGQPAVKRQTADRLATGKSTNFARDKTACLIKGTIAATAPEPSKAVKAYSNDENKNRK